jgi:hypothetical protein
MCAGQPSIEFPWAPGRAQLINKNGMMVAVADTARGPAVALLVPFGLTVDADNNNGDQEPDRTYEEVSASVGQVSDSMPEPLKASIGKIVDPAGANGNPTKFIPVILQLPKLCDWSKMKVQFDYSATDWRLWTDKGGGAFIPDGVPINASNIPGISADGSVTLYIECLASAEDADSKIEVKLVEIDGQGLVLNSIPVRLLSVEIVPDFDRDGVIDANDRGKVSQQEPWRFWVNDDDDTEETDGDDNLEAAVPDSADEEVKTKRDLLDFFPLYLKIGSLLKACPPNSNDYFLQQDDSAVNVALADSLEAYTADPHYSAASYQRDDYRAGTFVLASLPAGVDCTPQHVARLTPQGRRVDPAWLQTALNAEKRQVLLVEANKETTRPLVLLVKNKQSGQVVARFEFPLSIKRVGEMYRWINLRSECKEAELVHTNIDQPLNWPDNLCSDKVFVFVHGYSVNEKSARDWNAEIFKRMYWSGSKAKFVGVTWRGSEGKLLPIWPKAGGATPDYWTNVQNAFNSASHLKTELDKLSGAKYIAAHSLGNMLVSSAMVDHHLAAARYFMIDAAVPREAYEPATVSTDKGYMSLPSWRANDESLWSANFYQLFGTNDARRKLTWKGRFQGITNVYQFYSSGEEVLETNEKDNGAEPKLVGEVFKGRKAWIAQEMNKGRAAKAAMKLLSGKFDIGKWDHNAAGGWDRSLNPQPVTHQAKVELPFFDPFSPRAGASPHQDSPAGAVAAKGDGDRAFYLAEEVPALSFPAGSTPVESFRWKEDLNEIRHGWPEIRSDVRQGLNNRWLHCDLKDVSYLHTFPLFIEMVNNGGLK